MTCHCLYIQIYNEVADIGDRSANLVTYRQIEALELQISLTLDRDQEQKSFILLKT